MKIIFFGSPYFSIPTLQLLHESKHQVLAIVTNEDRRSGRGLALNSTPVKFFAQKHNYDYFTPHNMNANEFIDSLKTYKADVYIVVAYRKLPENVFNIPKFGAINLHASLLPELRGAAPIQHAFLNNLKLTGVTTFQINKNIDSGLILLQKKQEITKQDNYSTLYEKLSNIGAHLTLETIHRLSDSKIIPIKQDKSKISYAPKISNIDRKINWNDTSLNIINKIKAFSHKPGAYTNINGKRLLIFNAVNYGEQFSNNPGNISYINNKMIISTVQGSIELLNVQIEGKKKMKTSDFIKGIQVENFKNFQ